MFMDGVVDNVAAKQEINFFSPKTWKRADMTVYRAVGSGCEIGSVAGELPFFCEKSMLQQWVILVKKRFGQLLLLSHSEMYKYVLAPGVILSVEGWSRNSSRGNSPLLDPLAPSPAVGKDWGRRREGVLRWTGKERDLWRRMWDEKKDQKAAELSILSPHPNRKAEKGLM